MSTRSGPAGRGESRRRSAGAGGQRPLLHGRGRGAAGVLRRPHTICRESGRRAGPGESGALASPRNPWEGGTFVRSEAEAFLLLERLFFPLFFFLLFTLVLGLDVRAPYHWGMTGTVGDITPTRVSHRSGPLKMGKPGTVLDLWSTVLNKPHEATALRELAFSCK